MIIHLKIVFILYDLTATLLTLLLYDSTKDFVISLVLSGQYIQSYKILGMQISIDEVEGYDALSMANS
jgi:regulation of enolase protein 1 (concanavalin A-like superfamily)